MSFWKCGVMFSNLKYQHINTKGCFKQLQKLSHRSYVDLLESSLDGSWHFQPARVAGAGEESGHWSSSLRWIEMQHVHQDLQVFFHREALCLYTGDHALSKNDG